ncbi:MAG: LysM domain-containing protein [Lachnospiraceae bacterium]|nr:LysM domain-containing protein [Lachnospiraceae bacterium]
MRRVISYYEYITQEGDTFDLLALDMYNDERLAHYIIEYNPDYSDVIVFEGGALLKLPVVEAAETSETIPPWRRTE